MADPINLTDGEFDTTINSGQVVLVDFWAEWCGPCRMIAPSIKNMANDYEGKAVISKLDVDTNPATAASYGVSSIPTVMIFKDGEIAERFVGVQPQSVLAAALEKHLG